MRTPRLRHWTARLAKGTFVGLTILICALVVSLWTLSYFRIPSFSFECVRLGRQTHYDLRVLLGCINLIVQPVPHYYNSDSNLLGGWTFELKTLGGFPPDWSLMRRLGLVLPRSQNYVYRFPLWIPLLISAILLLTFWRISRRPLKGHCKTCNYNLTGNTTGICPECGTPCQTAKA
jgi:hypothetical protein